MNKVTTRTVVTFHIDSHAKIEFILPSENLNAITCFEGAAIILYLNDQTYNLNNGISAFDDIRHDLDVIIEKLVQRLHKNLFCQNHRHYCWESCMPMQPFYACKGESKSTWSYV